MAVVATFAHWCCSHVPKVPKPLGKAFWKDSDGLQEGFLPCQMSAGFRDLRKGQVRDSSKVDGYSEAFWKDPEELLGFRDI